MLQFYSIFVWKNSFVQGKITQIFGCSFLIICSLFTISFYSFKVPLLPVSDHRHPDPLLLRDFLRQGKESGRLFFKCITKSYP